MKMTHTYHFSTKSIALSAQKGRAGVSGRYPSKIQTGRTMVPEQNIPQSSGGCNDWSSDMFSQLNQKGMVSFLVTFIMLLVISLIVVGFTRVASQNRREALDRQLSTQAFYAAESGVNAVLRAAKSDPGILTKTVDTCSDTQPLSPLPRLSTNPQVKVTCILVDPIVPYLEQGEIMAGSSAVFKLDARDAEGNEVDLTKLVVVWHGSNQSGNASTGCPTNANSFKSVYTACDYGLLRLDLLNGSYEDADKLVAHTRAIFAQPTAGTPAALTTDFVSADTQAYRGLGKCVSAGSASIGNVSVGAGNCAAVININTNNTAPHIFYLRTSMMYNKALNLQVYGFSGSVPVQFAGDQVSIDSTGKAIDVLRRVQVRMPIARSDSSNVLPFAAYAKNGVCKRFTVAGDIFENDCVVASDPDDDSEYEPCQRGQCGDGDGENLPRYFYGKTFYITSDNDLNRIEKCIWTWGDGSPPTVINDPAQCNAPASKKHMFEVKPPRGTCYQAKVSLDVYITGLAKPKHFDKTFWVPFSKQDDPYCPDGK